MAVTLKSQALVTVEEALAFLQDQGSPSDGDDLLKLHINGISSLMLQITGRRKLLWVDGETVTEYIDGNGSARAYTAEAPIVEITALQLLPNQSTPVALTVPAAGSTFSDDLYFKPSTGLVGLTGRTFPEGDATALITYEAGYQPTDPEIDGLKMIALEALAMKWSRWKDQRHGVTSKTRGDQTVAYAKDDLSAGAIKELRRYRRALFA